MTRPPLPDDRAVIYTGWRATGLDPWLSVAPRSVALAQVAFERGETVTRMRQCGMTLRQIGGRLGVSPARVAQILSRHEGRIRRKRTTPPIMRWAHAQAAAFEFIERAADDEFWWRQWDAAERQQLNRLIRRFR